LPKFEDCQVSPHWQSCASWERRAPAPASRGASPQFLAYRCGLAARAPRKPKAEGRQLPSWPTPEGREPRALLNFQRPLCPAPPEASRPAAGSYRSAAIGSDDSPAAQRGKQ
jgi:hypothetical protein